jgi:hypothetical protein
MLACGARQRHMSAMDRIEGSTKKADIHASPSVAVRSFNWQASPKNYLDF